MTKEVIHTCAWAMLEVTTEALLLETKNLYHIASSVCPEKCPRLHCDLFHSWKPMLHSSPPQTQRQHHSNSKFWCNFPANVCTLESSKYSILVNKQAKDHSSCILTIHGKGTLDSGLSKVRLSLRPSSAGHCSKVVAPPGPGPEPHPDPGQVMV